VATGEACDDGNTTDGDGCQADCAMPTCGDGVADVGEICDDGNTTSGDGCNATCTSDETCGNGVVDADAGEFCDMGADNGSGSCTTTCGVREATDAGSGDSGGSSVSCNAGGIGSIAPTLLALLPLVVRRRRD
ncbi:MAG: DUF4215 domain-containing protein, partial [Myxococcota bacterium]